MTFLILFMFLVTSVLGAPSTKLTLYKSADKVPISSGVFDKIEQTIKDEIRSNVVNAYLGLFPEVAAASCKEIGEIKPDYHSGYYWIIGTAGPVGVYCEMETPFEQDGGWMRIANVDMTERHSQCPNGLQFNVTQNKHNCRRPLDSTPGCSSTLFPVHDVAYKKVCGKVIGYQYKNTNGFGPARFTPNINDIYVDGVSITRGTPRQHIWTLAAATGERYHLEAHHSACPCIDFSREFTGTIPTFVGNDYYCETGNRNAINNLIFTEDPLWDGEGCQGSNMCCDRGGPWFCRELPNSTTDSVELRVCTNIDNTFEDLLLEQIEVYVQ